MSGNSQRKRRLDVRVAAVGVLLTAPFLMTASGAAAAGGGSTGSDRTRWRQRSHRSAGSGRSDGPRTKH